MRPVRIVLVFIALIVVGLAGWALGARGGYGQPGTDPAIAEAPSASDDQATQGEVIGGDTPSANVPSGGGSSGGDGSSGGNSSFGGGPSKPPVKKLAKPSIQGLGTIPDSPHIGTALHLPPAPGEVIFVFDIANATRTQAWIAPTGTAVSDQAVWLGEDRNGRNGWTARWRYTDQVPLAHLIVRATGPGGTTEEFYPVTNNGGADPTEEVAEEVTEEQKP